MSVYGVHSLVVAANERVEGAVETRLVRRSHESIYEPRRELITDDGQRRTSELFGVIGVGDGRVA